MPCGYLLYLPQHEVTGSLYDAIEALRDDVSGEQVAGEVLPWADKPMSRSTSALIS
jgi:hypothetical protein